MSYENQMILLGNLKKTNDTYLVYVTGTKLILTTYLDNKIEHIVDKNIELESFYNKNIYQPKTPYLKEILVLLIDEKKLILII